MCIRRPLALPVTARSAVIAAMTGLYFRPAQGRADALAAVSLAGWRSMDAGSVALRQAGDSDQLVIDIPATLPAHERERSYRAALQCLSNTATALGETEPGISDSIRSHMKKIALDNQHAWAAAASVRAKDRPAGLWLSNWGRSTPAPMVQALTGRWLPIGVCVTTPTPFNYFTRAIEAASWVGSVKRLRPLIGPNGKPTSRSSIVSRQCGRLYNANGKAVGCLRYAASENIEDQVITGVPSADTWFWEVSARGTTASEPGQDNTGLLLVTAWSHADGVLGYGENLLAILTAFAEVFAATDPQAHIQTLYMSM